MRILVTGANGMVGRQVMATCKRYGWVAEGYGSLEYDLRDPMQTEALFEQHKPTHVIHLAARVGGVKMNMDNQAEMFHDNVFINANVLRQCEKEIVKKAISVMSTCVYPDKVSYPISEKDLHNGEPHSTNFAYAYAKRMLDVQSRAINEKVGFVKCVTAIPNNIYGEYDNYDLVNSHVVPALTRKIYEARLVNSPSVTLWGTGEPEREFTYSRDIANNLIWLLFHYQENEPINIGTTDTITIKNLAKTIASMVEYKGEILWDTTKPTGQLKRPMNNNKFQRYFKDNEGELYTYMPLSSGLGRAVAWFVANYNSSEIRR